jgi:uncharacterized repeat protein (TIGR03803 family)
MNDYGTVYKVNLTGDITVLYDFSNPSNGNLPYAHLIKDSSGAFYGTTVYGGEVNSACSSGCGLVFKVDLSGTETVLYRFTGGADGANPYSELIRDAAGNLYGTTSAGGDLSCYTNVGCGTVFKLAPSGTLTVLHAFSGGADGASPQAGLIRDGNGNFYGVALNSETIFGTIFKLSPTGKETILHTFSKQSAPKEGADPKTTLVRDAAGNLYGSTFDGGPLNYGTAFKLNPAGKLTVLHAFTGGKDGGNPAGLVRDAAGNLYGVAEVGGHSSGACSSGCGTIFELKPSGGKWTTAVLHTFTGYPSDGANSFATLLRDKSGHLYGTTYAGGTVDFGIVFKLTP